MLLLTHLQHKYSSYYPITIGSSDGKPCCRSASIERKSAIGPVHPHICHRSRAFDCHLITQKIRMECAGTSSNDLQATKTQETDSSRLPSLNTTMVRLLIHWKKPAPLSLLLLHPVDPCIGRLFSTAHRLSQELLGENLLRG